MDSRKLKYLASLKLHRLSPLKREKSEEGLRNYCCPKYSLCLMAVAVLYPKWEDFSCRACRLREDTSGKATFLEGRSLPVEVYEFYFRNKRRID